MRTTLKIDDEVLGAVGEIARTEKRSLGSVVTDLARRDLRPTRSRVRRSGDLSTFAVSARAAPLMSEMVGRALGGQ